VATAVVTVIATAGTVGCTGGGFVRVIVRAAITAMNPRIPSDTATTGTRFLGVICGGGLIEEIWGAIRDVIVRFSFPSRTKTREGIQHPVGCFG
jgi:hypothetical protein